MPQRKKTITPESFQPLKKRQPGLRNESLPTLVTAKKKRRKEDYPDLRAQEIIALWMLVEERTSEFELRSEATEGFIYKAYLSVATRRQDTHFVYYDYSRLSTTTVSQF